MSYGGDLSPKQCWELLSRDESAFLIDVRTAAEWAYVGLPLLDDGMREIIRLEWAVFPEMSVNPSFVETLNKVLEQAGAKSDAKLCFLCRSGVRSLAAAREMTAHGYPNTFNIVGGFEGDLNNNRHRGNSNGWKVDGLPWQQF